MRRRAQLFALIVTLLVPAAAQADIILPGTKRVRKDTTIDFGSYAERAPWPYTVLAGDTLSALAEKHLESAARYPQILELKAGLTADGLKAGTTIVMPPKSADSSLWMHFFAVGWGNDIERAYHKQPLHHHHYWTHLWAVPHARLDEFLKRIPGGRRSQREALRQLTEEAWVAKADEKLCGYQTYSDTNATAAIVESYTIDKVDAGKIVLAQHTVQKLDKDRKPLSGAALFVTPTNTLLLLLTATGSIALFLIARRRRSEPNPEPSLAT